MSVRLTIDEGTPPTDCPSLADVSLAYVAMVIKRCDGDKKAAAKALGVSVKTVCNKIAKIEARADLHP